MTGRLIQGHEVTESATVTCDVCIIGSGAGGAVLASGLTAQGLNVVMLEAGGHYDRAALSTQESVAYPMLYQERGGRATADQAIIVLQGRSLGGSTTVNWTTCYRTPERILRHWAGHHGLDELTVESLAPHFDAVEERLSIKDWPINLANENNRKLYDGAKALGWDVKGMRRNIKGCANTGFCGLGCPVEAKQAMGVTYIPDAIAQGLTVYSDVEAQRLVVQGERITAVEANVIDRHSGKASGKRLEIKAKVTVSSCGAINGPALFIRSGLGDRGPVGKRTFLHPVVSVAAYYEDEVEGYYGAPQSVGSHHFIDRGPERFGFFLEVPPLQPMLASSGMALFGDRQLEFMSKLPFMGSIIALSVDGLIPGDQAGTVSVRADGRISLDYPISDALVESFTEAHHVMCKIAMAAGAQSVITTHAEPLILKQGSDLSRLSSKRYGAHEHAIFSAHQMGGCPMGSSPRDSVVDSAMRHHSIHNLFVVDGSALPTALGVNPSETIYALARRAVASVASAV